MSASVALLSRAVASFDAALSPVTVFVSKRRGTISKAVLVLAFATTFLSFFPWLIKETGSWALRLLLAIMFLSPLSSISGSKFLKTLMPFRKEVGILMGVLAGVHAGLTFFQPGMSLEFALNSQMWIGQGSWLPNSLGWWLAALVFTLALTVTSNRFSMKALGKKWKPLHRTAYLILILTYLHVAYFTGEWASAIAVLTTYFALRIAAAKGVKIPPYGNS